MKSDIYKWDWEGTKNEKKIEEDYSDMMKRRKCDKGETKGKKRGGEK